MQKKYIAHVKKQKDGSWEMPHLLKEHLSNTGKRAKLLADKFKSGSWGEAAGYAHDVGKGRLEWQKYLKSKSGFSYDEEAHLENQSGRLHHAIHGAKLVEKEYGKSFGRLLSYIIAGHHSGLADWSSAQGAGNSSLNSRLNSQLCIDDIDKDIVENIKEIKPSNPPWQFAAGLDLSLWIRMIYSTVVDADFLDTEEYMDIEQASARGGYASLPKLQVNFNNYIGKLESNAADSPTNRIRRQVREKCIEKGKAEQGIYSLAVPTGGGKTLSSLAFALEHGMKHNLDRIIYVIPYTSIIEQNANVLRSALGDEQVIEHHSNIGVDEETKKSRLAAENWDAPIIVTTSVQFYESLFAAKSSRCRKLHNIARSVVILDEAQLVPVEYLLPILETMQLLVDRYGVSFVISTATQPTLQKRKINEETFNGLNRVEDIMGEGLDDLYRNLKRVRVSLPSDLHTSESWDDIASSLIEHDQVLCVVSDRKSCRDLHALLPEDTYHLSALMCGQHRSDVIKKIKNELALNNTVRVISTQLVEAGVDIDFPVVYRALAGLDSIAQAAGRCNREGRLPFGELKVFVAPHKPPVGFLRKTTGVTMALLSEKPADPLARELFEKYFSELYMKAVSLDSKDITSLLTPDWVECGVNFRTAAERFKLIDDSNQKTVIVRYGDNEVLINTLITRGPERWLMRKLQRYTVNVYLHEFNQLLLEGAVEEVSPHVFVLKSKENYSSITGLIIGQNELEPEDYII